MPPTSRTSNDALGSEATPASLTSRIHVLVTPTEDVRALLSTLAALSVAREPRMRVTALAPKSGMQGWTFDPRFRVRLPELGQDAGRNVIAELELGPEDVVVFLRAGALAPRGWLASILGRRAELGARAVAALPWHPRPQMDPATELLGWEAESQSAQLHHHHHSEDRADVETPLLAVFEPNVIEQALADFWRSGCTTRLALRREGERAPRMVVAKDLLVWQAAEAPALVATLAGEPDELFGELPRTLEAAGALESELRAQLEDGSRPELHLRLAELAIARGDRTGATRHARACLDAWPEHVAARLVLAYALIGEERLVAARKIIEALLSSGPLDLRDRASAFACLGKIWLREGEPTQARPCLDVALGIDADHPIARFGMARIAMAAGRFAEALEHLELSLQARPLSPDLHYELGRALVLAGQLEDGMQALGLALQLRDDHAGALALLDRLRGH